MNDPLGPEPGLRRAFVVRDGAYVSARWPGDAFTFAKAIDAAVQERVAAGAHCPP